MQCTPSIVCEPKYEHLAAGVISIYAIDPQSHTIGLCSGESEKLCTARWQHLIQALMDNLMHPASQLPVLHSHLSSMSSDLHTCIGPL